jgi:hypothetical protein
MNSSAPSSNLFGDDDEDSDKDNERDLNTAVATALSNNLFIELMRLRTTNKQHSMEVNPPDQSLANNSKHIAIFSLPDIINEALFSDIKRILMERVTKELKIGSKYITENSFYRSSSSTTCYVIEEDGWKVYDIIIFIGCIDLVFSDKSISFKTSNPSDTTDSNFENFVSKRLLSGGRLLCLQTSASFTQGFSMFSPQNISSIQNGNFRVVALRKRLVSCNNLGAAYWTQSWGTRELSRESALVENLTIELSVDEVRQGILHPSNHKKAVRCLREHGLCIIPNLFDPSEALKWGSAAKEDMVRVVNELWRSRELDLLHPYSETEDADAKGYGKYMENYYELSMREALRCDLRNGQVMLPLSYGATDLTLSA